MKERLKDVMVGDEFTLHDEHSPCFGMTMKCIAVKAYELDATVVDGRVFHPTLEDGEDLRPVTILNRERWERVKGSELRVGDRVRFVVCEGVGANAAANWNRNCKDAVIAGQLGDGAMLSNGYEVAGSWTVARLVSDTIPAPEPDYPVVELGKVKGWLLIDDVFGVDGDKFRITRFNGETVEVFDSERCYSPFGDEVEVTLVSPRWEVATAGQLAIGDAVLTHDGYVMGHTRVYCAPDDVQFVIANRQTHRYLDGGQKIWRLTREPARTHVGVDHAKPGGNKTVAAEFTVKTIDPSCIDCGAKRDNCRPIFDTASGLLCGDCATVRREPIKPWVKPTQTSRIRREMNTGARYHDQHTSVTATPGWED